MCANASALYTISQATLIHQLQSIFPSEKPLINVRKETKLKYSSNASHYLELDVWYSKYNICFEFQDNYHYATTWYSQHSSQLIKQNDIKKRDVVQQAGITLVVVPCWWDGTVHSLSSTVYFHCPDLVDAIPDASPISLNPPLLYFPSYEIPDIGELMYASFPSSSETISNNAWWLGEKYDGVRYCWNPIRGKIYSRLGNDLPLLPQMTDMLITPTTDGELWFGRGLYSMTIAMLNRLDNCTHWSQLRMVAFDTPVLQTKVNTPFEYRYGHLLSYIPYDHPYVQVVVRLLFNETIKELDGMLQLVVRGGGEGIILRKVGSYYEFGRSSSLLKVKSVFGDAEAVVTGVTPKLVKLQLPQGMHFVVPQENVQVKKLSVGDVVTFSYETYSQKWKFVNPRIHRVRSDLAWPTAESTPTDANSTLNTIPNLSFVRWNGTTTRRFMESFMMSSFSPFRDPLVPQSWYHLLESDLIHIKKWKAVIMKYNGYVNAVLHAFPDVPFDRELFVQTWSNPVKQRNFFEKFAMKLGFDPLIPHNWYLHASDISAEDMISNITHFHENSIAKALMAIFPEIGLDESTLVEFMSTLWRNPLNRRKYFENYAAENRFDPLIPENWYLISKTHIRESKRAQRVLSYHSKSVTKALYNLFPDIGLDKSKLSYWKIWDDKDIRKYFDDYAKSHNFDPLVAENWYSISGFKDKTGQSIVNKCYGQSFRKAVTTVYQEVKFNLGLFTRVTANYWKNKSNARMFFDTLAKKRGFDPLQAQNWYNLPRHIVQTEKGGKAVLPMYGGSMLTALTTLYPEVIFDYSKFPNTFQYKRQFVKDLVTNIAATS